MLIQKWWSQLLQKAKELEISEKELQECKNNIVTVLDKVGRISILRKFLNVTDGALDYLYSNGFLIIENNFVSFTHQSLLDYFLEENMLYKYQNGSNIEEIIGDKSKQTPARRFFYYTTNSNKPQKKEQKLDKNFSLYLSWLRL